MSPDLEAPEFQGGRNPPDICHYGGFVLPFEPQNDNAGVLVRRTRLKIGEIQIEGQQDPAFVSHSGGQHAVIGSRQMLVPNGLCVETGLPQSRSRLNWEILIYFEFHAGRSTGRSMTPSRASSAAYASAASMSSGFNEG
jgi:hypothetical protein